MTRQKKPKPTLEDLQEHLLDLPEHLLDLLEHLPRMELVCLNGSETSPLGILMYCFWAAALSEPPLALICLKNIVFRCF